MFADRRPSPRALLLGSVSLLASCAAVGIAASSGYAPAIAASPIASAAAAARMPVPGNANASIVTRSAASVSAPAALRPAVKAPACPDDMVLVDRSCVDRYEAHLLEKRADGSLAPHPPHLRPSDGSYVAACRAGVKPQAFISQREAGAACKNAGKRLCGLTEWYRACTGSERTTYPYGAKYEAKRCNVGKKHLLSILHGASSRNWSYASFNDPRLALEPGFLAQAGEYEECASDEGVHDMVGNLHEWVSDKVDRSLPSKLPVLHILERRIGRNTGNGIFMGGFFSTTNEHGAGCKFTTAAHDVGYHDYSTGFRCCADVE